MLYTSGLLILTLGMRKIVFIENTGYPLQALQDAASAADIYQKEVEFISLQCNDCPPGLTYGYPELTMLDVALPQSRLCSEQQILHQSHWPSDLSESPPIAQSLAGRLYVCR